MNALEILVCNNVIFNVNLSLINEIHITRGHILKSVMDRRILLYGFKLFFGFVGSTVEGIVLITIN